MYHSPAAAAPPPARAPNEEEEQRRTQEINHPNQMPLLPAYQPRSPPSAHHHVASGSPGGGSQYHTNTTSPATQYPGISGSASSNHQQPAPPPSQYRPAYSSRPSSSAAMVPQPQMEHSPRLAPAASPSNGHLPPPPLGGSPYKLIDSKSSTYYDPTSDHRDKESAWNHSSYASRPGIHDHREAPYTDSRSPHMAPISQHSSPSRYPPLVSPTRQTFHAHPPSHPEQTTALLSHSALNHSPRAQTNQSNISSLINGSATAIANGYEDRKQESALAAPPVVEEIKTRADPMSFSSILSTPTAEKPSVAAPASSTSVALPPREAPKDINGDTTMPVASVKLEQPPTSISKKSRRSPVSKDDTPHRESTPKPRNQKAAAQAKKASTLAQAAVEDALRDIEILSDADLGLERYAKSPEHYAKLGQKRIVKVNGAEEIARKKRRIVVASRSASKIDKRVQAQREEFRTIHEREVLVEVQAQEVMDEKERKKDMQRKRRREKTIHQETEKLKLISEKIESTQDPRERERLIKDHHRSQKKVNTTKRILDHSTGLPDELDLPAPPLPAGGLPPLSEPSPEPGKRRGKGMGTRLKKTKEQKQAEKDKAYNAAMETEPVTIAPKEEKRKEPPVKEESKPGKRRKVEKKEEETTPPPATTTYTSKGYLQIYDQIWKDIARKDVPKVYRIKETSLATKQSNLRKTAQLASKEARRWQLKTNKSTKDTQARAKRCMKEMMSFWKRNEREERDMRRVAERQELDNARKAEAEREANRQKRKLNFLIQQTELYSHFIGKKVKTDEVERSTDSKDVGVSQETIQPGIPSAKTIDLPTAGIKPRKKVTNFEDLDFDDEDESNLEAAAMANAQHAIEEAQSKARAFNQSGEDTMAEMDDGELNFQNPTGLGETDIPQPKMLDCQLKEYQLKGLNWLVNLYEQGINGILADEMGLGKTVQSISVMAYLAETHNIWGPFLVIAPASTLHNWQQEITRFVPRLKVIPYWGAARDRKILRKFWDRRTPTYKESNEFHCLITSYQLVVQDTSYFQKMRWQYMILDEAQAIKSSSSSRWKSLLGFHCRNRLLLTGTPIQNNMQELWALLHFIMPSLFDSHDEFSDWFSRDIESHAQSNTKLNEDQLKRLHMILKPFMLRRVKKHVQKELGDKIEEDVYCDLTYRQRSYYSNLRNKISIMDLIEKAASGDDQDTSTLMNLVMQFRKVCNHPDLFERADISSPMSMAYFAETASFVREGHNVNVGYSTRNLIEYDLPRLLCSPEGRLDLAGPENDYAGWRNQALREKFNIWTPENIRSSTDGKQTFSWLRFVEESASDAYRASHTDLLERAVALSKQRSTLDRLQVVNDDDSSFEPKRSMLNIVQRRSRIPLADVTVDGHLRNLMHVSRQAYNETGLKVLEQCARPRADAPPISISCSNQDVQFETQKALFNTSVRLALFELTTKDERTLLEARVPPSNFPAHSMLPAPNSSVARYTNIQVPSMRRFVTDSGKLAKLDQLLGKLKEEGHRVLLYFQMTRMIDLMEEYLTYRNYKYLRLDGSTKLEDRRDTVHDFQTRPDIFIFLLSTRAGGLGINLTGADTVIFYDSDWNPTIDSQAMDRAHRLGQTKQVTVYRMITRNTIEERIRKRALQKEEVQRVVISGGSGVDFNTRSKENKTKDIALWLADDEQAEMIEQKSKELEEKANDPNAKKKGKKAAATGGRKKDLTMDDMYHEGEGNFDDQSAKPSADATPMDSDAASVVQKRGPRGGRGLSKKAKTAKQRLAIADGSGDVL